MCSVCMQCCRLSRSTRRKEFPCVFRDSWEFATTSRWNVQQRVSRWWWRLLPSVTCRSVWFTALTLLIGQQEEHPVCKNWVMRCWWGYLPGARYRLSAYGPADATAIPKPHHLLLHSNPDWFYLSSPGLPRQYSHRPLNRCSSSSSHVWKNTCRRLHKTT